MRKISGIFLLFFVFLSLKAEEKSQKTNSVGVGIEDKEMLGKNIPLDLKFTGTDGRTVALKDIINKPTVLSLVYYDCPGICTPLLDGVINVVNNLEGDFEPGKDFDLVTISFDHKETIDNAKRWKEKHLKDIKYQLKPEGWRFYVGDSTSIRALTDAVGFYFKQEGERDYLHGASLIVISPKGQIIRYLFGTSFLPFDIKMATSEAWRGEPGPTVAKILDLCFKYDAAGNKYVLNLTRIIGTVMLTTVAILGIVLYRSGKKREKEQQENIEENNINN